MVAPLSEILGREMETRLAQVKQETQSKRFLPKISFSERFPHETQ
jgi:hypothetical protein